MDKKYRTTAFVLTTTNEFRRIFRLFLSLSAVVDVAVPEVRVVELEFFVEVIRAWSHCRDKEPVCKGLEPVMRFGSRLILPIGRTGAAHLLGPPG